jgi:pyrroline-5-carboxylate reductase
LIVKSQVIDSLLEEVGESISTSRCLVSITASKKASRFEEFFEEGVPVLWVTLHDPMLVGIGTSVISAETMRVSLMCKILLKSSRLICWRCEDNLRISWIRYF